MVQLTLLIELILITFASHGWLVNIFEFFLFTGPYRTHRFKEREYPRKYSFLKRNLMLTYFDKELMQNCRYKKQMKAVIISDWIYLATSMFITVLKIYSIISNSNLAFLDISEKCFFALSIVFSICFTIKSVRWKEWIKGNWRRGNYEFKIKLPDEKKKKSQK